MTEALSKIKTRLIPPYTMRPTECYTFHPGKMYSEVLGYRAAIYDADGYIAGFGLRERVFDTPEEVWGEWGDRPGTFFGERKVHHDPEGHITVEFREWKDG